MNKYNLKKLLSEAKNRREKRVIIFFMVKLGFSRLSPSDKVTLTQHVVDKMTGNANFPTPTPTLASVTTAADNLFAAEVALDGTKAKTEARNTAEAILDSKMKQLQGYVDMISNGNIEVALSSGMEVNNPRTVTGLLGPATDITVALGPFPGSVDIKWSPITNSRLFVIEARQANPPFDQWDIVGETTKSRITIGELQSGATYTFRITCISSAGPGPKSETFNIRVY